MPISGISNSVSEPTKGDINPKNYDRFATKCVLGPACCTTIILLKVSNQRDQDSFDGAFSLFLIHQPCNPKSPDGGSSYTRAPYSRSTGRNNQGVLVFFLLKSFLLPSLTFLNSSKPQLGDSKKKSVKHTLYETNKHIIIYIYKYST